VAHFLHDVDFAVQVFQVEFGGEDAFVDYFYGYRLAAVDNFAPVDAGVGTLA
jgi:hypothetical protein